MTLRYSQGDATQPQFIPCHDACAKVPAQGAYEAIGRRARLFAAARAANDHRGRFDGQRCLGRRAAAGAQDLKCTGEQIGLNATERSGFDGDVLHGAGAAVHCDVIDLS